MLEVLMGRKKWMYVAMFGEIDYISYCISLCSFLSLALIHILLVIFACHYM